MSDSIFDKLFELFQSSGPINWKMAAEVRRSIAGDPEVIDPSLVDQYIDLAGAARLHLDPATHLDLTSRGRLHPVDRTVWADDNAQSFGYALEPLSDKLLAGGLADFSEMGSDAAGLGGLPMEQMMASMGPTILGMQAGSMVGFLSQRVLGQFDTGLPALDTTDMYLIVPNIEQFIRDHSLDSSQVRMWATAQAVMHSAILEIPWVRARIVSTMAAYYESVSFDQSGLNDTLANMSDPTAIQDSLSGMGSLSEILGVTADKERLGPVQALFASIEGYADFVVKRGLGAMLPQLDSIRNAVEARRAEPNEAAQFLEQLVGLNFERGLANDASALFTELHERWGDDAIEKVWTNPDSLPQRHELSDAIGWAARVMLDASSFDFSDMPSIEDIKAEEDAPDDPEEA